MWSAEPRRGDSGARADAVVGRGAAIAPASCSLAIVGGGILGLALARELTMRLPSRSICVLERESRLAAHQSGHNSGVIHSGIYYAPGSLKARLCTQGASELYDYCVANGVPHRACGKLIVASDRSELGRLQELERRASANGVPGVRRIDRAGIEALEPHARGIAALHSPRTGVVDFNALALAFAGDAISAGAQIVTDCEVLAIEARPRGVRLRHRLGVTEASHAICCAGAWSDRLAVSAGASADPRIVPFRGAYLRLRPERRSLVRSLIYPVPDPSLPFLGVHISRHVDDQVTIGPTALLAGARDAYRLRTVRARDVRDTLSWPGSWRLFARWWRSGARELHRAVNPSALVAAAARYLPELDPHDVEPGFAGVRAQALARDGSLLDDFAFSRTERVLHVRNAPSPAATSSLAIARYVADEASGAFGLEA